jgi:hypothetical protein
VAVAAELYGLTPLIEQSSPVSTVAGARRDGTGVRVSNGSTSICDGDVRSNTVDRPAYDERMMDPRQARITVACLPLGNACGACASKRFEVPSLRNVAQWPDLF